MVGEERLRRRSKREILESLIERGHGLLLLRLLLLRGRLLWYAKRIRRGHVIRVPILQCACRLRGQRLRGQWRMVEHVERVHAGWADRSSTSCVLARCRWCQTLARGRGGLLLVQVERCLSLPSLSQPNQRLDSLFQRPANPFKNHGIPLCVRKAHIPQLL